MDIVDTRSQDMGLERQLRVALAGTHLEMPRPRAQLGLPSAAERMFDRMLAGTGVLRPAAVLVPVIRHADRLSVLLTVRAAGLRAHGGQIAFPGGARDADDASAVDNALREAQEEVGLDPSGVEIVGYLNDYPTLSRFLVTPVVGLIDGAPALSPHDGEVAEVFELPFEMLADRQRFERKILTRDGLNVPFFELNWQQYRIWGATAGMLWELAGRMSDSDCL
ncbi:CoA pyrophosphatase [Solimonas marina]|uniref:CoA pyrophosphatase n=1 Tax=Solimonas marina TaxID=2714601 RepID=A0A970B6G3_9GAMM|nr:CoA pyrophosphatase [Solimonas marina]NKF22595.1 CoA pyrophosphatase [Solimonas marina]